MMGMLVTYWPGRPIAVLAIAYEPPLRAARVAPPSLRAPTINQEWLTQLAAVIEQEPGR